MGYLKYVLGVDQVLWRELDSESQEANGLNERSGVGESIMNPDEAVIRSENNGQSSKNLQSQANQKNKILQRNQRETKILFIDRVVWNKAEEELFKKMIQAMKLHEFSYSVAFMDQIPMGDLQIRSLLFDIIVDFSDLKTQWESKELEDQFATKGPRDLLRNDQLKRETWEVLKKVMLQSKRYSVDSKGK